MKRLLILCITIIAWFTVFRAEAQQDRMIRVNGVVIDGESLQNIPYANVRVKDQLRTTYSNESGVFSIYAFPEDTLVFSIIGYNSTLFILPEEVKGGSYSLIQRMYRDTVMLQAYEVSLLPADFQEAFMGLDSLQDSTQLLNQRIDSLYAARFRLDQFYYEKRYYFERREIVRIHNQLKFMPPNHWFEPWRWAEYVRDVKNGLYKGKGPVTDHYFYHTTWRNGPYP